MKKKRIERLTSLHQRSRLLERSFIEMTMDERVSPIFVDEFLSSVRSFSEKIELMKSPELKENEDFWQAGNFAMGKLNRVLASLRLFDMTKKYDSSFLSEAKEEVLSLQKELHELIRSMG